MTGGRISKWWWAAAAAFFAAAVAIVAILMTAGLVPNPIDPPSAIAYREWSQYALDGNPNHHFGEKFTGSDAAAVVEKARVSMTPGLDSYPDGGPDPALLGSTAAALEGKTDDDYITQANNLRDQCVAGQNVWNRQARLVAETFQNGNPHWVTLTAGTVIKTGIQTSVAEPTVPTIGIEEVTLEADVRVVAIDVTLDAKTGATTTVYFNPECGWQPVWVVNEPAVTPVSSETIVTSSGGGTGGGGDNPPTLTGCADTQTWTPSYGQQAEMYTSDPTGGGSSTPITETPANVPDAVIDETIPSDYADTPDLPTGDPEVPSGNGKVTAD